MDATAKHDFGNIDTLVAVDWDGEIAWEMTGEWGALLAVEPIITIVFE